jgi:hypothetical protein
MPSPLHQTRTPHPEKGVALIQDLLLPPVPVLALAQAAGATTTIMCLMMISRRAHHPSVGTCTPPRTLTMDISIALTKKGKRTHK